MATKEETTAMIAKIQNAGSLPEFKDGKVKIDGHEINLKKLSNKDIRLLAKKALHILNNEIVKNTKSSEKERADIKEIEKKIAESKAGKMKKAKEARALAHKLQASTLEDRRSGILDFVQNFLGIDLEKEISDPKAVLEASYQTEEV